MTSQPAFPSTIGSIGYLERLELYTVEKPFQITIRPKYVQHKAAKTSNFSVKQHEVRLQDFSNYRELFSTDVHGFELTSFPTSVTPEKLKDLREIEDRYHDEARQFLSHKYDASLVFIFDSTIRKSKGTLNTDSTILKNQQVMRPSTDCHVDQSPESVKRRVRHNFPDEADDLLQRRVRVIKYVCEGVFTALALAWDIWRPLSFPCQTRPLGLCDFRTTQPADYTKADLISPVWEGEMLQLYYNPNHKWWFPAQMQRDDALLIKMYDSKAEQPEAGIAMCAPHCSFDWQDAPLEACARESLEIRAIVFS